MSEVTKNDLPLSAVRPLADEEGGGKNAVALHYLATQPPAKPLRRWAAYPLPLEDGFLAQVVLPLDLSPSEARRIQELIATLVVPWRME
jgi:hypothetical protein